MGTAPPVGQMLMPNILARSLNTHLTAGWTYNPRSDRHSVIKCVGTLLDLVRHSSTLRKHIQTGEVVFGINSPVSGKYLDLVLGVPDHSPGVSPKNRSLQDHLQSARVVLDSDEMAALGELGDLPGGLVRTPHLALECKAVMTDHAGAMPRLTDELERFRGRVQGSSSLAVALVMVNVARQFVSPGRNDFSPGSHNVPSAHKQPEDTLKVIRAVECLPFDATGMIFVDCQNNGNPLGVREYGPENVSYTSMVLRVASLYDDRFGMTSSGVE